MVISIIIVSLGQAKKFLAYAYQLPNYCLTFSILNVLGYVLGA
jgi:hypothetical protein